MDKEVWDRHRNFVGDEKVRQGVRGSHDELNDLKHGQGALEKLRDPNRECGESVVSVLRVGKLDFPESEESRGERQICGRERTINACKPEFTTTNIQIGGDMYRIPAQTHIIAPA